MSNVRVYILIGIAVGAAMHGYVPEDSMAGIIIVGYLLNAI